MSLLSQKLALGVGATLVVGAAAAALTILLSNPDPARCGGGEAIGATIGGDFSLTDQTGRRVTLETLRGAPALLYFGYTFCPDVCPTGLATISDAVDRLDAAGVTTTPVFITVDPERDTQSVMADYVAHFHPRMLGLTGTAEEVAAAAKAFRVYYAKAPDEDFPGGYAMDHSGLTYMLDADGAVAAFFQHGGSPEEMADAVACRAK